MIIYIYIYIHFQVWVDAKGCSISFSLKCLCWASPWVQFPTCCPWLMAPSFMSTPSCAPPVLAPNPRIICWTRKPPLTTCIRPYSLPSFQGLKLSATFLALSTKPQSNSLPVTSWCHAERRVPSTRQQSSWKVEFKWYLVQMETEIRA